MTSSFHLEPGHTRSSSTTTLKLVITGAAILLLAGGGALAYATLGTHSAATAATSAAAAHPTLAIGVVSGAPGIATDVPIRLAGAGGVASASFTITYDPTVVAVDDARIGPNVKGELAWHHDAATGTIVMLLTTAAANGLASDATLAILTLTAHDGAVGHVSPLAIKVRSAVHADGTDAALGSASGSFRNGVPGDVNGDGRVTADDYVRLASYLVGDDVTIVQLNADINGDAKVTEADAVLLLQQLDRSSA